LIVLVAGLVIVVVALSIAVVGPRPEKTCKLVLLGSKELRVEDAQRVFPDAFRGCTRIVRDP
jgi:hypothetical protein